MSTRDFGTTRRSISLVFAASVASLQTKYQVHAIGGVAKSTVAPLNAEEAQVLAQQYADVQAKKDLESIVKLFAEDGVYVDTQNTVNGTRQTPDEIGEYFRQLYESYPDLMFSVDAVALHTSIEPPWSM